MPLDELALRVLRHAKDSEEWNWRNWMLVIGRRYPRQPEVQGALAEAWNWLFAHTLVTWNPNQDQAQSVRISRLGDRVLAEGLPWLQSVARLDVDLLPVLEQLARPHFLRGDFETASFVAMKEVEVQVRRRAGFGHDKIGTTLMVQAFKQGGPLFRDDLEGGESQSLMNLFQGAIGLFKNPSSHRRVDFSDPTEAAEIILLADLLLRLLHKVPATPAPQ